MRTLVVLIVLLSGFLGVRALRGSQPFNLLSLGSVGRLPGFAFFVPGDLVSFAAAGRKGKKFWRHGRFAREDKSGRVVINMGHYFVRRAPRAVYRTHTLEELGRLVG